MRIKLDEIIPSGSADKKQVEGKVKLSIRPVVKEGFYVEKDNYSSLIKRLTEISVKLYAKLYFDFVLKTINDHELTGNGRRIDQLFCKITEILSNEEFTDAQKISSIAGISEEQLVSKLAASYRPHKKNCFENMGDCCACEIENILSAGKTSVKFEDTFELIKEFRSEKIHISESLDDRRIEELTIKLKEVFSSEFFIKNIEMMKRQMKELVGSGSDEFLRNIIAARIEYAKLQERNLK